MLSVRRWRQLAPATALGLLIVGTLAPGAASAQASAPAQGPGAQVRAAELPELKAIQVPAAWRVTKGRGVTVAVLDTGVDPTAADLAGSVATGPDYTRGANPPGYRPPHLHGTFIASLIAGHGSGPGRAGGVIGVAPAARILSVRVILDDQEPGFAVYNESSSFDSAIADGIRYATGHGAAVINMSLGSAEPSRDTRLAIGNAIAHGVVVVAAAGNGGSAHGRADPFSYPASYTGVVSVAAVTRGGSRASFSQRNSGVVICAPGVNIIGAGPAGSYLQASGTSPASALVAGVAALIRSRYPSLSPALVEQALIRSATRPRPAGYSIATGFGEVDAVAALAAAARLAAARPGRVMAASGHFGTAGGPIQVVHRDSARIRASSVIAGAGALGFLLALVVLSLLTRRMLRDRRNRTKPQAAVASLAVAAEGDASGGFTGTPDPPADGDTGTRM